MPSTSLVTVTDASSAFAEGVFDLFSVLTKFRSRIEAHLIMTNFTSLNNIGISFLNRGNLDEAFNSFSLAMDLMKQMKESKERRVPRRRAVSEPIAALEKQSMEVVTDFCNHNMGCDSSTVCFVSKMTITLPEGHHTANDYLESSVLLFHLALTLHMLGLRRGMEGFLQRALKLYELSKTLMTQYLEDEEIPEEERMSGVGIQLVTSMLNNMGHIHYELKEYDTSRRYFDVLSTVVVQAQQNASVHETTDVFEGLMLNAIVLRQPPVAATA